MLSSRLKFKKLVCLHMMQVSNINFIEIRRKWRRCWTHKAVDGEVCNSVNLCVVEELVMAEFETSLGQWEQKLLYLHLKLAGGQWFKALILVIVLVLDLWLMQLDVSRSLWRKRFSQNSLWLCQAQCPVGMYLLHLATAVEALLLQSPLQSLPPLHFAVVLLQVSTSSLIHPK